MYCPFSNSSKQSAWITIQLTVFTRWRQCVLPSNAWFHGPTRVCPLQISSRWVQLFLQGSPVCPTRRPWNVWHVQQQTTSRWRLWYGVKYRSSARFMHCHKDKKILNKTASLAEKVMINESDYLCSQLDPLKLPFDWQLDYISAIKHMRCYILATIHTHATSTLCHCLSLTPKSQTLVWDQKFGLRPN